MFKALFNIFDPAEENALKERLVELSGVNKKYINFLKITIENDEYVHVTMIDDYTQPNKPILVLLHGLTGTSFCFFTIQKPPSSGEGFLPDVPAENCGAPHLRCPTA